MLPARRGCHGESLAGHRGLLLSRVELAASRVPEPRFRAAEGPGPCGVVQGLVEKRVAPHSGRSKAAPEVGSDEQREGAEVSLSVIRG